MKILVYICIFLISTKLIGQKIHKNVKIKLFKSEINVERNGKIEVSEKITCVFKKASKNRVFLRKLSNNNIHIKSLIKDKRPMIYEKVNKGDSVFIYFGRANDRILPGTYEFEFKYVIDKQISCGYNNSCSITWDVNGFNTGYAIDKLVCIVSADEKSGFYPRSYGGSMIPTSLFPGVVTGYKIEGGKYCSIKSDSGYVTFKSIKKYKPNEGQRIIVTLPKDYFLTTVVNSAIERDSLAHQKTKDLFHKLRKRDGNGLPKAKEDVEEIHKKKTEKKINLQKEEHITENQEEMIGLFDRDSVYTVSFTVFGILLIGLFYYFMWRRYGKDPPSGAIYPIYSPPHNLPPSVMGYIMDYNNAFTTRYFTSELLNLVSKNAIKIETRHTSLVIVKKKLIDLTKFEDDLVNTLFQRENENELVICPENRNVINDAREIVDNHCEYHNKENRLFNSNINQSCLGQLISLIYFVIGWYVCFNNVEFYVPFVPVLLALLFMLFVPNKGKSKSVRKYGLYVFAYSIIIFSLHFFATFASVVYCILWFFLLIVNYKFIYILRAPTILGQKYMSDIKGFKMYLSQVDSFRNSTLNSFQLLQNEFDDNLPYAYSLGISIKWVEEFEENLNNKLHSKNI